MKRLVLLAALLCGACDIPTDLPKLRTQLLIPLPSTTLSVSELLPAGTVVTGGVLRLELAAQSFPQRTLLEMCGPACATLEGQRVPKPAFTDSLVTTLDLPGDVASVTLAAGAVLVTLTHDFGFDPLQPPGATTGGYLAIVIRDDARVLAADTVRGTFPSGTTLQHMVELRPGEVMGDLRVVAVISSPAGGTAAEHWVTIRNSAALQGTVVPQPIELSQARVRVTQREITAAPVAFDLADIDESLRRRTHGAALLLTLDNPFTVSGQLTATLTGGAAGPIVRTVQVVPGESRQRIPFTREEVQSLLGHRLTMIITGVMNSPAPVTVRATDVLTVGTELQLEVEIGN
jgi:hypothetical protein